MIDFAAEFASAPIMLILRGLGLDRSLELAERAWDAGVGLVEVPLQADRDAQVLHALAEAGADRGRHVGAGTVIGVELVEAARSAGAAFTVAPGLDPDVVRASFANDLAHLPGVGTGTEIQRALALGCPWVKVFPAGALGADWVAQMRGPFPAVGIVATGGMSSANAEAFLRAGANAIAVGSALGDREELARLTAITS
jgi:Entner-Doudoroff aldolase